MASVLDPTLLKKLSIAAAVAPPLLLFVGACAVVTLPLFVLLCCSIAVVLLPPMAVATLWRRRGAIAHGLRTVWFLTMCTAHAAAALPAAVVAGACDPSRPWRYAVSTAVAQGVVRWGQHQLRRDPRLYRSVRELMDMLLVGRAGGVERTVICDTVDRCAVRGLLLRRPGAAGGGSVLLYLHGGGYCAGSRATHERAAGALLLATEGCDVAFVADYRLAPEHPYPAAVDDAVVAYAWLLRRHAGGDARRVYVAGDSAGGGLAVALALRLPTRRLPRPACCVCFSPMLDLRCDAYDAEKARRDVIQPALARACAEAYLAGADPAEPLASPALAPDLSALPPVLLQVGGEEIFADEAHRFAEAAPQRGGSVTCEKWDGMAHGFHFAAALPQAAAARGAAAAFAARHLCAAAVERSPRGRAASVPFSRSRSPGDGAAVGKAPGSGRRWSRWPATADEG